MMASASGGLTPLQDLSLNPFASTSERKFHLQLLLDHKEKQLQQAGALGQRVLAQQIELEEKIRHLQDFDVERGDDEDLDTDARERYRELADTVKAWDVENAQLSSAFGQKRLAEDTLSPAVPVKDLPRDEPERSKASSSSAAQSRRAKNAAHRADDVEFAFEIGSGLLTEVRRLQSLLGERDKAIQDMKEEKDDLEKSIDSLRTALRSQEQSSDKFKEENWNLEVTLQELRTQLSDSQSAAQRIESEHKRLTKLLNTARESADQHKTEAERTNTAFDEFKAKHDTEFAQARKHAAGLQRDKSDLQSALDAMKAEVAKANRRLGPKFGSPLTPGTGDAKDFLTPTADEDDVFTTGGASTNRKRLDTSVVFQSDSFEDLADVSPDPSPSRPFHASNHPNKEIEALQQRLFHAERQIKTLKGSLHREKEMRLDYKRRLEPSPGYAYDENEPPESGSFEDIDPLAPAANTRPRHKLTPFRTGAGRGRRGRGGVSLAERFGRASRHLSPNGVDALGIKSTPHPPVPSITGAFLDLEGDTDELDTSDDDHHDEQEFQQRSLDVSQPGLGSNRTSVDGMDPAFANVLRKSASHSSIQSRTSPLRQSVLSRSGRGGAHRRPRGGAAFQAARPPSFVGQPEALSEALSAELGIGMTSVIEGDILDRDRETKEAECQTEDGEVTLLVPTITPVTTELGVQTEAVTVPSTTAPLSDMSSQTDDDPQHADMAVQHIPTKDNIPVGIQTSLHRHPYHPVFTPTPRRTTFKQSDFSKFSDDGSGDSTVRNDRMPGSLSTPTESAYESESDIDDGATETGAETETDVDDYHDARMSVGMTTPSEDFHSMLTISDNDFSESDEESIKASRISSRASWSSVASFTQRREMYDRRSSDVPVEYDDKAVGAALEDVKVIEVIKEVEPVEVEVIKYVDKPVEVEVIKYVEQPKPEVREMSIQTDAPTPGTPTGTSAAIALSTPSPGKQDVSSSSITPVAHTAAPGTPMGLYRVGTNGQQFQFVTISPPASPISEPTSTVASIRDSVVATFNMIQSRVYQSEQRQSVESTTSVVTEDLAKRTRTPSNVPSAVDKTRPPTMALPPPPRQPPPPSSMLPPSFIPERRFPTTSSASGDGPPPRPSSPPPPELIQRATTPTFGSMLSVTNKGTFGARQHGSSMPPSSNIRQLPSTSSFRSAANAAAHAQNSHPHPPSGLPSRAVRERERREMSSTSLTSDRSALSPRSSMSSDHNPFMSRGHTQGASATDAPATDTTDPSIIHAITQTMIGEFLYKYTRRTIGKGYGEKRHKRFFWVHPYTKTLYWSSADPGSSNVSESSAKSAYIEGVRSVLDPNPMPPGLFQYSVVISTAQREMKITAPTKERHDIWLSALKYLLARPNPVLAAPPNRNENGAAPTSPVSHSVEFTDDDHRHLVESSPQSQRSGRSSHNGGFNTTPRGTRSRSQLSVGGSLGKRAGTPAAEFLRWAAPESPYSPTRSFEQVMSENAGNADNDEELEFELHGGSDDGFEGLENVRACCDGRHTVGPSGHHHSHPHAHSHHEHLEVNGPTRPVSPAWSMRSRTGSTHSQTHSHEAGGLFSWARGDDGKLRFGSRRSARTVNTINSINSASTATTTGDR
ncbi:coiled-coil protein [Boletus edulis]|nr:coiled-coil protein [Boletus edulis]